jgi:hypothetical protein
LQRADVLAWAALQRCFDEGNWSAVVSLYRELRAALGQRTTGADDAVLREEYAAVMAARRTPDAGDAG